MVQFDDCSSSSSSPEAGVLNTKVCRSWTLPPSRLLASPSWWNPFTTKSISTQEIGNQTDKTHHIDELPDEILILIFSLFEVKEIVVASLVSRRWNQISRSKCKFNFDWFAMFETRPYDEFLEDYSCHCQHHHDRYIRGLNQHLQFNKSLVRWYLRISFCFGKEHTSTIDAWVRLAISMGIKNFFLNLSCGRSPFTLGTYVFHPGLFSEGFEPKFTFLSLRSCVLGEGVFGKLYSLKQLALARVSVGESEVKSILSCCVNLEELSLYWCVLPQNLCITGPDLHLKTFRIHLCEEVQDIKLSAINLTHFSYLGEELDLSFDEVPHLESMYIRSENRSEVPLFNNLVTKFPPVKLLSVYAATSWVHCVQPSSVSRFQSVEQLTLFSPDVMDFDMLKMTSILRACQNLGKLHIVTEGFRGPMTMPFGYVNKSLKRVELGGFYRIWDEIEFVRYLLECAVSVEEIVIDPRMEVFDGWFWTIPKFYEWDEEEREKFRSLLQGFIRAARLIVK